MDAASDPPERTEKVATKKQDAFQLTQHLLDHMGLLPLVAQEVCREARENDAAAYQAFKRSSPEGHDDHEDAAQNKSQGDEQRKLEKKMQGVVVKFY